MSIQLHISDHILLEDDYILAIHKPGGLMVEPDRNNFPNLLHQVQKYVKASLPIGAEVYAQHLHRLDRPVSGIVLFAKQKSVLRNLSEQFAERKVKKIYQALTDRTLSEQSGRLEHWHRKEKKKAVLVEENTPWAEKAILDYAVESVSGNRFLWKIELHTGKFHQIRVQLASVGCPILGDVLYGSDQPYLPDAIALQACKLVFTHPITGELITIESGVNWSL